MTNPLQRSITIFSVLVLAIVSSCHKEALQTTYSTDQLPPLLPPPISLLPCASRPMINARLEQVGLLSAPRSGMLCATAGNKILFIDGDKPGGTYWNEPSIVDIYDFVTNTWSTAGLSGGFRTGAAIVSVGNKIFFAGGGDAVGDNQTSRVDIYDANSNSWSITHLSIARMGLAATFLGDKAFFGGGAYLNATAQWVDSDIIDIYNNSTNTWTTAKLAQGRMNLSASNAGSKIFFAGGRNGQTISNLIDIYDSVTDTWSTSVMTEPRAFMTSIAIDNKVFWAGGLNSYNGGYSSTVEIRDLINNTTAKQCLLSRHGFDAVRKDDNIIFFTGDYSSNPYSGTHFEIYNITNNIWSVGVLPQRIDRSSIISVNNTIYVAGGISGPGQYNNQVWKLEF